MRALSEHFTLAEVCATLTGLPNQPTAPMIARLASSAQQLEKVRALLGGHPIRISSGYRSPEVNKAVGGSLSSAHVAGFAFDFSCPAFGTPRQIVERLRDLIVFDQLIWEHPPGQNPWVHVSFDPRSRHQVLECPKPGVYLALPKGITP